jgi:hypothetical protein
MRTQYPRPRDNKSIELPAHWAPGSMPSPPEWFDFTRTVAIAGFCISVFNLYFTWQSRKLAREQEHRRLPRLVSSLINGYFQKDKEAGGRVYAFLVTVTNPTDSNNAIAKADLAITCLTADRTQMTVKIRTNGSSALNFVKGQDAALAVPASISAHNAISGWLRFHVPAALLEGVAIESYRLVFTDPHGEETSVAPILVQEYRDET